MLVACFMTKELVKPACDLFPVRIKHVISLCHPKPDHSQGMEKP